MWQVMGQPDMSSPFLLIREWLSKPKLLASFLVTLVCGLIAYCHQQKKPSLHISDRQLQFPPLPL